MTIHEAMTTLFGPNPPDKQAIEDVLTKLYDEGLSEGREWASNQSCGCV